MYSRHIELSQGLLSSSTAIIWPFFQSKGRASARRGWVFRRITVRTTAQLGSRFRGWIRMEGEPSRSESSKG